MRWGFTTRGVMVPALAMLTALAPSAGARPNRAAKSGSRRLLEEKTGTLTTREGLRLHLVTDLGSVRILAGNNDQVSYKVRIETDARDAAPQDLSKQYSLVAHSAPSGVQLTGQVGSHNVRGHLWVSYEVTVPSKYSLDVLTQAGNIETQDVEGRVVLVTSGGNILTGHVGGPEAAGARLETQGGHITVQEVNGELRAVTAGGHINVANVHGGAVLRSGGGHIRTGAIQGAAELETGGGNISVQSAGGSVTATTGGGQIELGEAAGSIRARTGGGGIRIVRVAGPTEVETGGGSIFLTKVRGAVHASTGAGSITAWFSSDGSGEPSGKGKGHKMFVASQLESGNGDIVVYLPHELAVTIEATIALAGDHSIEADPALPLKVSYVSSDGARALRGECALNGGGELLRLKTAAGNIQLKLGDTDPQIRLNEQQMDQLRQRLDLQQQRLRDWQSRQEERTERQAEREAERLQEQAQRSTEPDSSGLEGLGRKIEQIWRGGVRVDPDEQRQKLVRSVQPVYPDVAKRAGIEGTVLLKVVIAQDGIVKAVKVVSGEPVLADAAADAVKKWRYQPTILDGKPVNVVTTVAVEFRLR